MPEINTKTTLPATPPQFHTLLHSKICVRKQFITQRRYKCRWNSVMSFQNNSLLKKFVKPASSSLDNNTFSLKGQFTQK